MLTLDDAKTGLATLARIAASVTGYANYAKPMSLTDAGKLLRIEPRVIVSSDCLNHTSISSIMQAVNALYSATWLCAADVLFKVDNARTIRRLDQLQPRRDSTGFLLLGQADLRFESYRSTGYERSLPFNGLHLRQEASSGNDIQQFINLSVGRQLEVDIASEVHDGRMVERKIQVNVRTKVTSADDEVITAIMTGGNVPRGWAERWRALMASEIDFVADGLFMMDIYRERMRLGVKDREGLQRTILQESAANKRWGVLTQAPSLADASNVFVISTEMANREIRPKIGGNLADYNARKKIFDVCPVMIIVEVDREKNKCRFYVRGEEDYALVNDSEMKSFKDKGPDVMELFTALQTSSFNRF